MQIQKAGRIIVLLLLIFACSGFSVQAAESDVILIAYQDTNTSLSVKAFDPIGHGYVGDLTIKVWSAKNSQDDLKTETLNYAGGNYTFTINTADHNNDNGIYYLELYGPSGLLKSDFATIAVIGNEWTQFIYENGHVVEKTCRAILAVDPEIVKNSTEEANAGDDFKSGYGYTTTYNTSVLSNIEVDAEKATTGAGNARLLFPEFNYRDGSTIMEVYGQFDRLTDCTERTAATNLAKSQLELKENPFSGSNKRVHFTPIWYPDELDYTVYADLFDAWTPGGMLATPVLDTFKVDGNVYDDWQINEKR